MRRKEEEELREEWREKCRRKNQEEKEGSRQDKEVEKNRGGEKRRVGGEVWKTKEKKGS